ncbi:MAG: tetratricopeptide repeat protein [Pseudomonadota bacterium]
MRRLFTLLALAAAPVQAAEIRSADACKAAIAQDPSAARKAAADWVRSASTVDAYLCEATALRASGAVRTAAIKLTELAQQPAITMHDRLRADIFAEAGDLWLTLEEPEFAAMSLRNARRLDPEAFGAMLPLARAEALQGNLSDARTLLDTLLMSDPDATEPRLLRAQVLRALKEYDVATKDLATLPDVPEVQLERANLLLEQDKRSAAGIVLLDLIATHPNSAAASQARIMLLRLAEEPG